MLQQTAILKEKQRSKKVCVQCGASIDEKYESHLTECDRCLRFRED
ncbi:protein YhfH [Bacillus chungangensis]|uniref:Ribosomal protein L37AE/L43A n=1 Tax=Bacillus chungangensis TaxID=587633 RepID=A0ABT9WVT3_9BACI|nr:protein YhfH [Bacillus chungangensis]MDQ0177413.1 ribosomal protein L37AE/L43A [Bacillus chungangensis]